MAKIRNLLNNFMGYTKYLHGTRFKKNNLWCLIVVIDIFKNPQQTCCLIKHLVKLLFNKF